MIRTTLGENFKSTFSANYNTRFCPWPVSFSTRFHPTTTENATTASAPVVSVEILATCADVNSFHPHLLYCIYIYFFKSLVTFKGKKVPFMCVVNRWMSRSCCSLLWTPPISLWHKRHFDEVP